MTQAIQIFLSPPDVGEAEATAVSRAVMSGWAAPLGPEVEAFELEVAGFVGVSRAVALSSGTAALHMGLLTVGVRPGDVVITASMTFVATANAISYCGATPVFIDSVSDGTMDIDLVETAIHMERKKGHRVGAIVPVDLYGKTPDYFALSDLARREDIPLFCDSAESLGSEHGGQKAGSFGYGSALSFNGNKIITTSGGGMLLTNSDRAADLAKHLASQAKEKAPYYSHSELGFNYRLSNILAALGRVQVSRLPTMLDRRRSIRQIYIDYFRAVDGVELLSSETQRENCWLTAIIFDSSKYPRGPEELRLHMLERGIETRPLWKPLHKQPLFANNTYYGGNVSESLFLHGLVLPSGSSLTPNQLNSIQRSLDEYF